MLQPYYHCSRDEYTCDLFNSLLPALQLGIISEQAVERPSSHVVISWVPVRLSHGYRSLNNCGGAACQFSAAAAEMIFALVFYVSGLLQHDVVVNSWPTCVYQPKICTKNSFLQSEAATFIHRQIALAYSSHDKVIKLIKSHLSNQFWKASSQFHSFLLSFC